MKLRPCPFCGAIDTRQVDPEKDDYYVWCKNPQCAIYDIEIHVSNWNTRPIENELINALEELIEICPGKNGAGDFSREQRVWSLVKKALAKYKGESDGA